MTAKRSCPVCGNEMEDFPCEICKVCDWESDWYQEKLPDKACAPNCVSLYQARKQWKEKKR